MLVHSGATPETRMSFRKWACCLYNLSHSLGSITFWRWLIMPFRNYPNQAHFLTQLRKIWPFWTTRTRHRRNKIVFILKFTNEFLFIAGLTGDKWSDVFRVSDTHRVLGHRLLVDFNIFWIVLSRAGLVSLVAGDESSGEHGELGWSLGVSVLGNNARDRFSIKVWKSEAYSYRAGPGVLERSWVKDPICRRDFIVKAEEAAILGILGPINDGRL